MGALGKGLFLILPGCEAAALCQTALLLSSQAFMKLSGHFQIDYGEACRKQVPALQSVETLRDLFPRHSMEHQ